MQKKEKISKIKNAPAKKFIHVFAPAHHHPAESLGGVGFLPGSCGTVARRQRHGDNAYLRQSSLGPAEAKLCPADAQPTNLQPGNTSSSKHQPTTWNRHPPIHSNSPSTAARRLQSTNASQPRFHRVRAFYFRIFPQSIQLRA